MIFRMIKSEGIAHHSYFLGDGGKAAVIDPRRDVEIYQDLAQENDLQIEYIFETHRNEDYVIGSLEFRMLLVAKYIMEPTLILLMGIRLMRKINSNWDPWSWRF